MSKEEKAVDPNVDLTPEEVAELLELEQEVEAHAKAEALAAKRQHIDALRLRRKFSATHGTPGLDFEVVETRGGNFVVRRPVDVELDALAEKGEDRGAQEQFAQQVALHPTAAEVMQACGKYCGLVNVLIPAAMKLVEMGRAEEAKK